MITLHIIDIHFEPNNTFPHIWILHVALFDPIGSPLEYILFLQLGNFCLLGLNLFNFVTNSRRDGGGMEVTETWENFVNLGNFCTPGGLGKFCEAGDMRRYGDPFCKIYFEQVYWELRDHS